MKKTMGIWGMIALIVVALMCVRNISRGITTKTRMDDVSAYLVATYPNEKMEVVSMHYGGLGPYSVVRPINDPQAHFRVFYDVKLSPYPYYDTYYSLKLREPARAAVEQAIASVLPQARVFIKIWMLENETISTNPTLEEFLSKKSGSIGMYFALSASEALAFTKENMEAVLGALSRAGLKGPVTFGLLNEGQMGMSDVDVEYNFTKWCQKTNGGRVHEDGSVSLK